MTAPDLSPLANHLWQSTLCAAAAWLLTLAVRKNHAAVRYWVWLAASVKFLTPFSLLVSAGNHFAFRSAPLAAQSPFSFAIAEIGRPFALLPPSHALPVAPPGANPLPAALLAVWLSGFAVAIVLWVRSWRRIRSIQRAATPLDLGLPIQVMSSPARLEPGVFGIRNPVLLLPTDIARHLTAAELNAVIAHELCHVRRLDNLTGAIHMLVQAVFWFHPLLHWIGARLLEERERACDEEVLRTAGDPQVYAQGILNICKLYLDSPIVCVSGVTGSNLKKRIDEILAPRTARVLDAPRKLLLAGAGIAAVACPVAVGIVNAPAIRAQATGPRMEFEVASVKSTPHGTREFQMRPTPGDGLSARNVGLMTFIGYAYDVKGYQLSGGPAWISSETFDVEAKAPAGTKDDGRHTNQRLMLQSLLADRFKLSFHRETKQLPVYALEVAKGGPKLPEVKEDREDDGFRIGRSRIVAQGETLAALAGVLSGQTDRPVVDRTGLNGKYDFKLEFTPGEGTRPPANPNEPQPNPDGRSIFEALQEQLGLRLVTAKASIEILVIDHAEKPAAN